MDIYQSDNSDYSNPVRFNEVARCETNCPDQTIESNIITVPAIKDFTFDLTKYYKLYFLTYQSTSNFYGSADEIAYPNGQSTKDNGQEIEVQTSTIKDIYFILTSRTPLR